MSNDVTTTDTNPFGGQVDLLDETQLLRSLEETEDFGERESTGVSYLSFSGKSGRYSLGVNKRTPGEDEAFLVAVPLFKTGYIAWKGGKPVAKRFAALGEPPVAEPAPDDCGPFTGSKEGWSKARQLSARSIDNGEQIEFTNNSKTGVAEIAALHKSVVSRLREGEPAWPLIVFGVEGGIGEHNNYKPTFTVVRWLSKDEVLQWTGDFDPTTWLEEEEAPAPAPKRRARARRAM